MSKAVDDEKRTAENNTIGLAIKENRKLAGYTQKQLAELAGVTHAAISYWENGVNIPNVKDCWTVADVLGITIDDLVGRINNK